MRSAPPHNHANYFIPAIKYRTTAHPVNISPIHPILISVDYLRDSRFNSTKLILAICEAISCNRFPNLQTIFRIVS